MNNAYRQQGFTLIELLVVVAIIAILASLSIPVVGRAIESARRAQASTEVSALATAVRAYYNEYSRFPHQADNQGDYINSNAELLNVLRAIDGIGNPNHANNRRRITFLEVAERSLDTDMANPNFIDPWDNPYKVVVDIDFSGTVNARQFMQDQTAPQSYAEIRALVAVWSTGDDPNNHERYTTSWR